MVTFVQGELLPVCLLSSLSRTARGLGIGTPRDEEKEGMEGDDRFGSSRMSGSGSSEFEEIHHHHHGGGGRGMLSIDPADDIDSDGDAMDGTAGSDDDDTGGSSDDGSDSSSSSSSDDDDRDSSSSSSDSDNEDDAASAVSAVSAASVRSAVSAAGGGGVRDSSGGIPRIHRNQTGPLIETSSPLPSSSVGIRPVENFNSGNGLSSRAGGVATTSAVPMVPDAPAPTHPAIAAATASASSRISSAPTVVSPPSHPQDFGWPAGNRAAGGGEKSGFLSATGGTVTPSSWHDNTDLASAAAAAAPLRHHSKSCSDGHLVGAVARGDGADLPWGRGLGKEGITMYGGMEAGIPGDPSNRAIASGDDSGKDTTRSWSEDGVALGLVRFLRAARGASEASLSGWAGMLPAEEQAGLTALLRSV